MLCFPIFFSFSFVFVEVSEIKVMFVMFCAKSFACWMLYITKLMLKQVGVVSLILIFL